MLTLLSAVRAITQPLRVRLHADDGLEAIEYALIAALLSAIIVAVMITMQGSITGIFNAIATQLDTAATSITN